MGGLALDPLGAIGDNPRRSTNVLTSLWIVI